MEMPRAYMARCAQHGRRVIFQYKEHMVEGMEHLRFIGYQFTSEEAARRWDDRPGNLGSWWSLPSWEAAEEWLREPFR